MKRIASSQVPTVAVGDLEITLNVHRQNRNTAFVHRSVAHLNESKVLIAAGVSTNKKIH